MSILHRAKSLASAVSIAGLLGIVMIVPAAAIDGFGPFGMGGWGGGGRGGPWAGGPRPGCFGGRCGPRQVVAPCWGGACRQVWRPRPVVVRPVVVRPYVPVKRVWYAPVKRPYVVRRPYVAPVVTPAITKPACPAVTNVAATTQDPQFVFVIFQANANAVDTAGFLKTYNVLVDDGPNQDGYFKLKLVSPLAPDRLNEMISSMRTQTNVVSEVTS